MNRILKLALTIAFTGLVACGKSGGKVESSQIAAKVNGVEITTHQIDMVMKGAQNITPENVEEVRKKALEKLIDQQLVLDKAGKESLDRTPDVILAIEAAKKEILASAYLKKVLANSSLISEGELKKYYDEHPELFSKRRIYNLQDISMQNNHQVVEQLKEDVSSEKSIVDVEASLKAKGVKFSTAEFTRPAEQLPLDILPKLLQLKNGDMFIWMSGDVVHVIKLANIADAPVTYAEATPMIKSYFINTQGKKIVEDRIKKFRQEAKIEYLGKFAKQDKPDGNNKTDVNSNVVEDQSKTKKDLTIENGLAGLK